MKLYTEDQMKQCFNDAQMQWANYRFMYQDFDEYKIACSPTPIELPTDEEIEEEAEWIYPISKRYKEVFGNNYDDFNVCFKEGAKWILEQIKQQDK